jgi:hypothetical protein
VASGLSPAPLHQIPVPPQDRGRGNNPMQSACPGQQPGQCREHRAVGPGQSWPAYLAAQHRYLVAQHEDFRIFRFCAASQQSKPSQDLPEDQIQQSDRHGRRSCPTATVYGSAGHRRGRPVRHPQVVNSASRSRITKAKQVICSPKSIRSPRWLVHGSRLPPAWSRSRPRRRRGRGRGCAGRA